MVGESRTIRVRVEQRLWRAGAAMNELTSVGEETAARKPRRGGALEAARPDPVRRNALRRHEPQESHELRVWLDTTREETDSGEAQSLEGRLSEGRRMLTAGERHGTTRNVPGRARGGEVRWWHAAKVRRAAGTGRCRGFAGGKYSEGENPMSASGMKQGRGAGRGARRQEGAKP
jgi:hypothetical protein